MGVRGRLVMSQYASLRWVLGVWSDMAVWCVKRTSAQGKNPSKSLLWADDLMPPGVENEAGARHGISAEREFRYTRMYEFAHIDLSRRSFSSQGRRGPMLEQS